MAQVSVHFVGIDNFWIDKQQVMDIELNFSAYDPVTFTSLSAINQVK